MNTASVQVQFAPRGLEVETKRLLAVPQQTTGSHAFGAVRGHPKLVLTLNGPPGGTRVMRIRQHKTTMSYHLSLDDLSQNTAPLRPNSAPQLLAERHLYSPKPTPADSDFIISWTATETAPALPPTGFCSHHHSFTMGGTEHVGGSDSDRCGKTSSSIKESDSRVHAGNCQNSQHVTPALTTAGSLGFDVEQPADLELARSACEFPQLRATKRRSDEPETGRPIKRQRPSSEPAQAGDVSASADSEADSEDDTPDSTSPTDMKTFREGFPCPFSLRDPRGRRCSHKNMKSPRCVEKHLFSRHRRPPFCPVCGTTFHTYAECDTHIISRTCKLTESLSIIEGLAETQMRDLLLCLDARLSRAEQYRAMWKVVHEGVELPAEVGNQRHMLVGPMSRALGEELTEDD